MALNKKTKTVSSAVINSIGSRWFLVVAYMAFAVESLQLSLTSRFPMAFDEIYHYNVIQFYSGHWNPIVSHQPPNSYVLGALVQNPSFLYHYLLSFPYRLCSLFTHDDVTKILVLRIINIGFMLLSLVLMYKLLRLVGLSRALSNIVVFMFAFTPMVSVLGAQINYDNLLILATTSSLLILVKFIAWLRRGTVSPNLLLALLSASLFGSLVKYSFLPILAAIAITVFYGLFRFANEYPGQRLAVLQNAFSRHKGRTMYVLLAVNALLAILFVRVYGVNLARYHTPVPQCNQVLSTDACKRYYAWDNNYEHRQYRLLHPSMSGIRFPTYVANWINTNVGSIYGEVMPLSGPYSIDTNFLAFMIMLFSFAFVATLLTLPSMIKRYGYLVLLFTIGFIYVGSVFTRNYHDYLYLGHLTAINGRYALPVLVYAYALLGAGLCLALQHVKASVSLVIKASIGILVIVMFLVYGGYTQYIDQISPRYGSLQQSTFFSLENPPAKLE